MDLVPFVVVALILEWRRRRRIGLHVAVFTQLGLDLPFVEARVPIWKSHHRELRWDLGVPAVDLVNVVQ